MNRGLSIRRLRFSLRTLIGMLLFAGLGFSAFNFRLRDAERQAATLAWLKDYGGCVRYQNHHDVFSKSKESSLVSEWLTEQLGLDFFHDVDSVCITGRGEISNRDFESICKLRNIRSVNLGRTAVTDEGLASVSKLANLRRLSIRGHQITDQGVDYLCQLDTLESLSLINTKLTDSGLAKLASLKNLEYLNVKETQVSRRGVVSFHAARPDCKILCYPARY